MNTKNLVQPGIGLLVSTIPMTRWIMIVFQFMDGFDWSSTFTFFWAIWDRLEEADNLATHFADYAPIDWPLDIDIHKSYLSNAIPGITRSVLEIAYENKLDLYIRKICTWHSTNLITVLVRFEVRVPIARYIQGILVEITEPVSERLRETDSKESQMIVVTRINRTTWGWHDTLCDPWWAVR